MVTQCSLVFLMATLSLLNLQYTVSRLSYIDMHELLYITHSMILIRFGSKWRQYSDDKILPSGSFTMVWCHNVQLLYLLLSGFSLWKARTKARCWAAHLCLFNPRQGDVLCVELRVTQRFLSIIHGVAAASVLLFNSPADHIIPPPTQSHLWDWNPAGTQH